LRFAFASAGHVEPLLWCAEGQTTHFLSATGLPLGVENQLTCKTDEHALHPGDLLLLYSDGVSESQNQQGKVFGTQCLSDIIDTSRSASAENLIHLVVDSVAAYSRGFPLQDDLALVLLRSKPRRTLGMTVKPFVTRGEISSLRSVLDWTRANIYDQMSETYRGSHLDNFILALSEVMKNQVEHALEGRGGLIFGNLEVAGEGWSMDLFDRGHPMEKEKHGFRAIDPEDPPLRGYGFRIIHALLDNCTYQRLEDGRNHWHLFKRIRG
jgi:anti-sigma regulatory factor (Ser/Thr protein kinase)